MHFQKKPLDNISHPTSSTSPTPHKAYGYTEEELPVYVVTESDGESNSPVKIRSSSEPSHAANTTASPTPPPAQSPRFHLKPWMIVAGLCLVLGTGCCIFLACSPPSLPPVVEESSAISNTTSGTSSSAPEREISSVSVNPQIIESYYEGDECLQIYAEEYMDEEGSVIELRGVMDGNGHVLIPAAYASIIPLTPDRFAVYSPQNKWGLLNRQNEMLYPVEADAIKYDPQRVNTNASIVMIEKDKHWSMVNLDGDIISDTTWDYLDYYENNTYVGVDGDKAYVLNFLGRATVCLPDAPMICASYFDGALNVVRRFSKNGETFGVQDREGNTILPADYHQITISTPHVIIATEQSSVNPFIKETDYMFNEKGQRLTTMDYTDILPIGNKAGDYAIFMAQTYEWTEGGLFSPRHYLLDANGNTIFSESFDSFIIREKSAQVVLYQDGKTTVVDFNGNLVQNP